MRLTIDFFDGSKPKRGDIVQTNVGDKRERTCLILRVKRVNRIVHVHDPDPERAIWCRDTKSGVNDGGSWKQISECAFIAAQNVPAART